MCVSAFVSKCTWLNIYGTENCSEPERELTLQGRYLTCFINVYYILTYAQISSVN